jgi:uncharacterized protein YjbJ (UPF0337 family)
LEDKVISQIYRALLTISLISFFSFVLSFGIAVEDSWAATPFAQLVASSHTQVAVMDRAKAVTKDLEGKAQEAIGNVTGDPKDLVVGRAKQAEANVRQMSENVKDSLPERVKAIAKNLEGKTQEAIGDVTGDRKDQIVGRAKQVESNGRNLLEDAKETVKGLFK